jgi:hypothetical protein
MLRYNMVVITRDNALKRAVKRVTTATGAKAEYIGDASGINPTPAIDLAIFDARKDSPDKLFFGKVPETAKIIYIIAADSLVNKITLLKDPRVTSLFCHDERFDDDEFISTATKCLRGEVFGLQKYFPWGVTSFSMLVKNYKEKGRAIDVLMRYATLAGVRGPVRDRIQLVADELMMNALYHAPVDSSGREVYRDRPLKELAQLEEVNPIQVQYGCSGRYFGVAVRDGFGSLSRERALDYLVRTKTGSMIEDKATGAGLGLVSVLRSVSKLVFNVDHGSSTEAIGLFDMDLFARGKVGARSLHLFTEAPSAEVEDEDEQPAADRAAPTAGAGNTGKWALVAVLLAVVCSMATAYVLKQAQPAAAMPAGMVQTQPLRVTVHAEPDDAAISINGRFARSGVALELPREAPRTSEAVVSKPGFDERRVTFAPGPDVQLHVNLVPEARRAR